MRYALQHIPTGKVCEVESGTCYATFATIEAAQRSILNDLIEARDEYTVVPLPADLRDAATEAPEGMTLDEIQTAVRAGQRVHWKNIGYTVGRWVRKNGTEQWLIVHASGNSTGLTRADGVTMNEKPEDFFVASE